MARTMLARKRKRLFDELVRDYRYACLRFGKWFDKPPAVDRNTRFFCVRGYLGGLHQQARLIDFMQRRWPELCKPKP